MLDTIVSLATPPLKGALAVIRISGDQSLNIINKLFTKHDLKPNHAYFGDIINPSTHEIIDEVIVTYFQGPKSFTGEDVVEISCHGSMIITSQIVSVVISLGARQATPGEFSARAFYASKIDLVQAEAINSLINAETEQAKKLALFSLKGESSKLLTPIKERLAELLANIEVNIDYPEYQDIEEITGQKIVSTVSELTPVIDDLLHHSKKSQLLTEGIKVALVGKPNVGKSSLLNALLNQEKAIVTNIPGTTRDIVEGRINIEGIILNIFDTAGIRESKDIIEQIGIDKSKRAIQEADLVLLLLDATKGLEEEDQELLELTKHANRIIIYNKADAVQEKDCDKIMISALKKDISPLINKIKEMFQVSSSYSLQPALISLRETGLLERAKMELIKAKEEVVGNVPLDLVTVYLKQGYDAIRDILGEEVKIDLSEEVFAHFCVGK